MKTEIRKLLGTDKIIIGTDRTMKALRSGKLSKVLIASNTTDAARTQISDLATLKKVEIVNLDEDNEELGVLCKKPFRIAVLGFV